MTKKISEAMRPLSILNTSKAMSEKIGTYADKFAIVIYGNLVLIVVKPE